jgi:hypothetical protein
MYKKKSILLTFLFILALNSTIYAENNATADDQEKKVAELEKRIVQLEKAKPKETEKSTITFSGLYSARYKSTSYSQTGKSTVDLTQYRIRLDAKAAIDKDSSIGLRFVTKIPNKTDYFNDSWTTTGSDSAFNIDRAYYTTKIGNGAGSLTIGQQALVVDPMNIIMDSTFYSYTGGKVSYKLNGLGVNGVATAQYGRFYQGITLTGFTGWGNKSASDFNNADFASLSVNGKVNDIDYTIGYADFKNKIVDKTLLNYTFANLGTMVSKKVGMYFEYANNSADSDGSFWTDKIVYGDQNPAKLGQWNVSLQYIDAGKNAIFNRFALLEGATGKNVDHPENIWDARINYAFSPTTTFWVQRMIIDDNVAANNANDSKVWKAELDVKF